MVGIIAEVIRKMLVNFLTVSCAAYPMTTMAGAASPIDEPSIRKREVSQEGA
jgi:hypothetical protein